MLKNTEEKYQKVSNISRDQGGQRKVEKAKEQKENCSDKDNPATETRKSKGALATTYIHTWRSRGTDSKEGDPLKEKFPSAFMLNLTLTKNKASRLAPLALGHPWCSQNSLQHTCGLHPPAALWRLMSLPTSSSQSQSSSSSSSSLSSSSSPSSVLNSSHMHDWQFSATSPSLTVSASCVNSLQINTDVYITTNDRYSHQKFNTFIPTNHFTRLALHDMFLTSLIFKQAYMRMSLPLKWL